MIENDFDEWHKNLEITSGYDTVKLREYIEKLDGLHQSRIAGVREALAQMGEVLTSEQLAEISEMISAYEREVAAWEFLPAGYMTRGYRSSRPNSGGR